MAQVDTARSHPRALVDFQHTVVTHDLDEALYLGDRVLTLAADPERLDGELTIPRDGRDVELARLRVRLFDAFQRFHEHSAATAR
ncbi:hypothetical protein [Caballeronia sp. CLC5]|uniref:hypothetical protein n=1 Tax=Caballeronia sp. CLC5 TaxID=2906764 RepID=UPI001F36FC9A|nr:hypothetical protein [Caballeronia sp. CLC5]